MQNSVLVIGFLSARINDSEALLISLESIRDSFLIEKISSSILAISCISE